jgi:hypothetical protein
MVIRLWFGCLHDFRFCHPGGLNSPDRWRGDRKMIWIVAERSSWLTRWQLDWCAMGGRGWDSHISSNWPTFFILDGQDSISLSQLLEAWRFFGELNKGWIRGTKLNYRAFLYAESSWVIFPANMLNDICWHNYKIAHQTIIPLYFYYSIHSQCWKWVSSPIWQHTYNWRMSRIGFEMKILNWTTIVTNSVLNPFSSFHISQWWCLKSAAVHKWCLTMIYLGCAEGSINLSIFLFS